MRWWHVEPVVALERALFGQTAWPAETFWSELAQPSRSYVVAVDRLAGTDDGGADDAGGAGGAGDAAILGYAGVMVSGPEADVQTIAVSAHAQGRGVGALLLESLMRTARAQGAGALLLEVRADNAPALALYRRFAFEQIAVRRRYYQPGDVDALVMRRRPL